MGPGYNIGSEFSPLSHDSLYSVTARLPPPILFASQSIIWFTNTFIFIYHLSFHGFITNQFNDLLPVGSLAQLVERYTSIAEVKGLNPVQA